MAVNKAQRKRMAIIQQGRLDITFLALVLILLTVGLVMLFSASYAFSLANYNSSYLFILNQAKNAAFGVFVMFLASRVDYHLYKKFAWIILLVTWVMLALLYVFPPMLKGTDVRRWIVIGGFNFQPSEAAKFAITVILAALVSSNQRRMKSWKFILFLFGILIATVLLIFFETHVSAAFIVALLGFVILVVGGLQLRYVFGCIGATAGAVAILWFTPLFKYVNDKFDYWFDPWSDPLGKGFQTIQSLLAIGSGGIMGRGIGQSRQKYLWVPEPHNDFIFSIVCEELGLLGALAIIAVFVLLVWRGFNIAMRSKDRFGSLLAIGLTFHVGLQAMLNIFVVTNFLPNTGISLPFFSYGGTSLVFLLAEMGVVLSVSRGASLEKG